jgi:8-oxo-dGTP pyrophosphatase MutT (NUDIX family)
MVIQINNLEVNDPPLAAATVMVLRDGAQGLEVLMIQRHQNSDVLGGAHVFPGGKLDALDSQVEGMGADHPLEWFQRRLHEPQTEPALALGLHVAALRETLEESGLLIGQTVTAEQLKQARAQLSSGLGFASMLQNLGLALSTQGLAPWSRWVTPRMPSVMNKRFDTRFFVAVAPPDQLALHDNFEATESIWVQPRQGLIDYWEGRMGLAPPQIMSLSQLACFQDVASVLTHAQANPPVLTQPEPFDDQGVRVICYPGDPRHSNPVAGFKGPTRLRFVNKRFEPEGGLAALLPAD